jgi:hypothetical protein
MMDNYVTINIANDFSNSPGGTVRALGPNSGEAFFEDILEDKYLEAKQTGKQLFVEMDGACPYGSGFVDLSFGALFRKYGEDVARRLILHTTYFDWVVDYIRTRLWNQKPKSKFRWAAMYF